MSKILDDDEADESGETEQRPVGPPPPKLTSAQRQHLKGLAHPLAAIIQVGQKGTSDTLLSELDRALLAHELVKVKLGRHVPTSIDEVAKTLSRATGAAVVQTIGKVIVFFRPHPDPEHRKIKLPRRPPAK